MRASAGGIPKETAMHTEGTEPGNSRQLPNTSDEFGVLYQSTFETVYRYARMLMGNAPEAEDVTADVYLQAWRNRQGFRGGSSVVSWLLSITHNSAMSKLRKRGRETVGIEVFAEPADPANSPERELLASATAAEVRGAIQRLTPKQQHVILLRFFAGLSHKETGLRLGINAGAVRALQFRALRTLRIDIEKHRRAAQLAVGPGVLESAPSSIAGEWTAGREATPFGGGD
jgi:RNA polymerase sigma-70 factor (ECF subfamily)